MWDTSGSDTMPATRQDSVCSRASDYSTRSRETMQYESTVVREENVSCDCQGFVGMNPHEIGEAGERRPSYCHLDGREDLEGQPDGSTTSTLNAEGQTAFSSTQCSTSQSSVASDEQLTLQKKKTAVLEINKHTDFCIVESVKYRHRGETYRQHYVKHDEHKPDIEGVTGLKPLDELLSVNGKTLINRKLRDVKKIFKRIRPRHGGNIDMQLVVRRWKARDTDHKERIWAEVMQVQIRLVLVPIARHRQDRERLSRRFRVSTRREDKREERDLPTGSIGNVGGRDDCKAWCYILGPQTHLCVSSDGLLQSSPTDKSMLVAEFFMGDDLSPKPWTFTVFCVRLAISTTDARGAPTTGDRDAHTTGDRGMRYMISDLSDKDSDLQFKRRPEGGDEIDAGTIDERCFIRREIGDGLLLQSLIYRDKFVHFDSITGRFLMKSLSARALASLHGRRPDEELLAGYMFRLSPVYTQPGFLQRHIGGFMCGLLGRHGDSRRTIHAFKQQ